MNPNDLGQEAWLDRIFRKARSHNGYRDEPVSDELLVRLYDLVKLGPTSTNCTPGRFLFVRSAEARDRLIDCVAPANAPKIAQAPVTVIIGMDLAFVDTLPRLFPHVDARAIYAGNEELIFATAFRNSSLQGGYLIMAARALGLDCGPMSGFVPAKVDAAFWSNTRVQTNFLCTLGYGDSGKLYPRHPRLSFKEACGFV